MSLTTSLAGIFLDTVDDTFTRTNVVLFALGAVGAILSYQAGKKAGAWLYERHLRDRIGDEK